MEGEAELRELKLVHEKQELKKMKGDVELLELKLLLSRLTSDNVFVVTESVRAIRKRLSTEEKEVPALPIIENKGLILLAGLLDHDDKCIQFEALWALTNIASTVHTAKLASSDKENCVNVIPKLLQMLKSEDHQVVQQSFWCLGNIAGGNRKLRDLLLGTDDALSVILESLRNIAKDPIKVKGSIFATGLW